MEALGLSSPETIHLNLNLIGSLEKKTNISTILLKKGSPPPLSPAPFWRDLRVSIWILMKHKWLMHDVMLGIFIFQAFDILLNITT